MIAAAELLLILAIPTTTSGEKMLPLPSLEDVYLRKLFEHAVFGFYRHHLTSSGWAVKHGERLSWPIDSASPGIDAVLPGMQLDVTLERPHPSSTGGRRIVIDAKFTSVTMAGYHRSETLDRNYVCQINAYLMSQIPESRARSLRG